MIWVCLKIGNTPKPNGFADHYPYEKCLNGYFIGNINPTFSDKPISIPPGDHKNREYYPQVKLLNSHSEWVLIENKNNKGNNNSELVTPIVYDDNE